LQQQGKLRGRIAIVTGASRSLGIGAAICRALGAEGADIFFTHWGAYDATMPWGAEPDFPQQLAAELTAMGVRAAALTVDLSRPEGPAAALDAAEAALDAHYAMNIRGACLLSVEFARRFKAGSGGRIINMTSGQSKGPMPAELAYIATKGAIEAFTVSLAPAVGPLGITVNAVDPGPVDTGYMDAGLRAFLRPKFPMGRLGEPEDAARLIAFLASDDAAWITGQVIHSDGGFRD
jgi:3-oxoacyl-[acyl-carrier protein] reductase